MIITIIITILTIIGMSHAGCYVLLLFMTTKIVNFKLNAKTCIQHLAIYNMKLEHKQTVIFLFEMFFNIICWKFIKKM